MSNLLDDIKVIYEDDNFVALNKPAGLLVHPTKNSAEKTLADWLGERYPEMTGVGDDPETRPGIVHRLDRDTSGVILTARNQVFFEYLKDLFRKREVIKIYLALAHGKLVPKSGIIESPISLKKNTVRRTVFRGKDAKMAVTEYKVAGYLGSSFSLVELMPKTGRTHQVRIHLSSLGHPVVGDRLYSIRSLRDAERKAAELGLKRQFLHAKSLEFSLPEGRRIRLEADLSEDLREFLGKLKNSGSYEKM